jgi:hypothetical protein
MAATAAPLASSPMPASDRTGSPGGGSAPTAASSSWLRLARLCFTT